MDVNITDRNGQSELAGVGAQMSDVDVVAAAAMAEATAAAATSTGFGVSLKTCLLKSSLVFYGLANDFHCCNLRVGFVVRINWDIALQIQSAFSSAVVQPPLGELQPNMASEAVRKLSSLWDTKMTEIRNVTEVKTSQACMHACLLAGRISLVD